MKVSAVLLFPRFEPDSRRCKRGVCCGVGFRRESSSDDEDDDDLESGLCLLCL